MLLNPTRAATRRTAVAATLGGLLLGLTAVAPSAPARAAALALPKPGTVVDSAPLRKGLWIPGATSRAWKLTYVTKDSHGHRALSTGTVFVPRGRPPKGGWPVISWAHGTSGLGDSCAPSKVGPLLPERDWPYLRTWMRQGYAVVASDYVGLGTPGLMPYLDGKATAHSVVDMVKAGRAFTADRRPRLRLSGTWVTIGQSQGAGGAIYTARYATAYGSPGLDYRGAVGTGTPAYIEDYVMLLGPEVPPLTADLAAYLTYILASLRDVHPELGIDGILTAEGKHYLAMAEQECVDPFEAKLDGVNVGDWFTEPVALLPNFAQTLSDYMAMPTSGFDKPFFMANGLTDTDVPFAIVAPYVAQLEANGEPVEFHTYPTDHNGTMAASLQDSIPFVRARMS
jgi:hypothetical protein